MGIGLAVGALAAGLGAGTTFSVAAGLTLGFSWTAAALSLGLGILQSFMTPKPPKASDFQPGASIKSSGITQNIKQAITSRRTLYGEARIGGAITFIETSEKDKFLHMVLTLVDHEVEEIGEIWFDDVSIPADYLDGSGNVVSGAYTDVARIKKHNGTVSQTADSDIVAETSATTNFRGQGVAYIYVRLQYHRDVYPGRIPIITAFLKGKKLFDPRDDATRYSANSMMFVNDYLTEESDTLTPGVAALQTDIDDSAFVAASNVCEEMVTTTAIVDTIESAVASTDIMTLMGLNSRLQYQTGDQVNLTDDQGGLPGGLTVNTTNLILQSENIVNGSYWADARGTLSSNQLESPLSEEVTADLFTEDTATGGHYAHQVVSGYDTTISHTFSVYLKPNGRDSFRLRAQDLTGSGDVIVSFDLDTLAIVLKLENANSTYENGSIEEIQDGWFRISMTYLLTSGGGTNDVRFYIYSEDSGGGITYTGDGTSGFYLFGAQLEADATLNDYVKTETVAVSEATNYYVIPYQRKDIVRMKLAASLADALAGNAVNITSSGAASIRKNKEPRYFGGGIIDTAEEPKINVEELLTASGGSATYIGGKWVLKPAVYSSPVFTFDESHIISPIVTRTKISRRDRFNLVKGVYVSPLNDGQTSDYPVVKNSTYVTQDNGKTLPIDYALSFTQRPHAAQRLAKIKLEKHRQELFFEAEFKLHAMQVQPGDTVYINNIRKGWSNKIFEVITWTLAVKKIGEVPLFYIKMALQETASANYDWNNGEETTTDPAPNTNLRDPTIVEVVSGFSLDSLPISTQNADRIYNVIASWEEHDDAYVSPAGWFEVEYKETTDVSYNSAGRVDGSLTQLILPALKPESLYDIQIIAYNNLGVPSQPTVINNFMPGTSITTNTEDWEHETLLRDGDDWETDTLGSEDWEA